MEYATLFETSRIKEWPCAVNKPKSKLQHLVLVCSLSAAALVVTGCGGGSDASGSDESASNMNASRRNNNNDDNNQGNKIANGKEIFRFDTFGDETQWTDTLRLHEVIRTAVSPLLALSVGLKVDAEALPAALVKAIQKGDVDLNSPATTVALLKLNAVVGLQGKVENINGVDTLTRLGVTCALCHSTVDDSFAPVTRQ